MSDPTPTLRPNRPVIARGYARAVSNPRTVVAIAATAVVLAALSLAGPASAAKPRTVDKSKRLWATINVCDTPAHPDTVGIRASMPGSGIAPERMFMRFQVQYFNTVDGRWTNIGAGGDSGFVAVGSARYQRREAGRSFVLNAPPAGQTYRVRGVVTFQWRRGDKVVRQARKRTRSKHPDTANADPKGFSAAECTIRPTA
jgi:hypothetical protein